MADKEEWLKVQRYMAEHNIKLERRIDSPAPKFQRTVAGPSSSNFMESSVMEPSLSFAHSTGKLIQGASNPIEDDNLAELLKVDPWM